MAWVGVGNRSFLLSAGFSNRNKSFKNQHTRRDGVRRSKDAPSIIGRNLFAHLHLSSPSKIPPVFHPTSNRPSCAFVWGLCTFHGGRDGETWMAYLFCLLEAQRDSRRRAEGMNDATVSNEIEGGFHPCGLTQREGGGAGCLCLMLQFYLFILKSKTRGTIQKSVSGRRNFFSTSNWHLWKLFDRVYLSSFFIFRNLNEVWLMPSSSIIYFIIALYKHTIILS